MGLIEIPEMPQTGITKPEQQWLAERAAALPEDAVIVHIGVAHGASLLCSHAGNESAFLLGIDTQLDRARDAVREVAELVQADSRTFVYEGEPIDFLLIDGAHDEGSVWADILNWSDHIVEGGIIAFHDYGNAHLLWCRGVKAAVDSWDWTGWVEIVAPGSIKAYQKVESE